MHVIQDYYEKYNKTTLWQMQMSIPYSFTDILYHKENEHMNLCNTIIVHHMYSHKLTLSCVCLCVCV